MLAAVVVVLVTGGGEDEEPAGPGPVATAPGGEERPRAEATPRPRPEPTPKPDTEIVEGDGELAIGITEPNPAFIHPTKDVPAEFGPWRDALKRMRPALYRLVIDWPTLTRGLDSPRGGCMRDIPPCFSYAGLVAQLEALAAAQRGGGWETMVVLTGTPDRYATAPNGCERAGTEARSRPPTAEGLKAYRAFLRRVQQAADRTGARLRYWSPWNEPNHPFGLSPQRAACKAKARSLAIEPYAQLARAMRAELRPGQEMVLGELAGLRRLKPGYTRISEFIRGLPRDVVCGARIFGQHGYVGGPDPVGDVERALRRFGCRETHEIWITETGAGAPRTGETRRNSAAAQRRACRNIARRLERWYDDPRVTAAFQYTLREDDRFPTGLVTVGLDKAYPALKAWTAWGRRPAATAVPPSSPC